jgi:hypothetical protein
MSDLMERDNRHSNVHRDRVVELTRVQPIEAEVIVARLRASGIPATAVADSMYPSLTVADGVPVFVPEENAEQAAALLKEGDESQ